MWDIDIKSAFEKKFSPEPNTGCWLWTGNTFSLRNGYGAFTHRPSKTIMQRAHRISWNIYVNTNITVDDHILHKCDNPLCVNPEHLFLGDQASNMEDKSYKGRQNMGKTHGLYKHGKYVGQKRNRKYHP